VETPSFKENHISQIPALQLLLNMGYQYLTPVEALQFRGNKTTNVILEDVLRKQLKRNSRTINPEIQKTQNRTGIYSF
jgi:type I restriction enzyme R subunit